jgi:hypothetical protein
VNIFHENAKTLCFDALIDKEGLYVQCPKEGPTSRRTTQPKKPNLGEELAKLPGARVRPLSPLGLDVAE